MRGWGERDRKWEKRKEWTKRGVFLFSHTTRYKPKVIPPPSLPSPKHASDDSFPPFSLTTDVWGISSRVNETGDFSFCSLGPDSPGGCLGEVGDQVRWGGGWKDRCCL